MKQVPKFKASVTECELIYRDSKAFQNYLFRLEGKIVSVVVQIWRKGRSTRQNSYYWGVILDLLSEHTGHTPKELDVFLKIKFLQRFIPMEIWDGEYDRYGHKTYQTREVQTILGTSELNTVQFEDYASKIRMWASMDLGLFIPEPNQVDWLPED